MVMGVQIVSKSGVCHSGQCVVQPPFSIQGFVYGCPGVQVTVKCGNKAGIAMTDLEGRFEVEFGAIDPGGPYAITVKEDVINKLSVVVEEDFEWGGAPPDAFLELIQKKRGVLNAPTLVATNQLIVVFGTKGGLGTSSLTAALARELYAKNLPVMVVEASRTGGSLLRMFGESLAPRGLDALQELPAEEAGESKIAPYLVEIRKGLEVLPMSGNVNSGNISWGTQAAKELYRWAVRRSGYVVVDAGSDLSFPLSNAALWLANKIFPLITTDPIGVDAAIRFAASANEVRWTRVIHGWVVRGEVTDNVEGLTGIKTEFILKNNPQWGNVLHGQLSSSIKKEISPIIDIAQLSLKSTIF